MGVVKMLTLDDMGEGGVQKGQNRMTQNEQPLIIFECFIDCGYKQRMFSVFMK